MHRIWFNPAIVFPTDGVECYFRFINDPYNVWIGHWKASLHVWVNDTGGGESNISAILKYSVI